MSLRGFCDRTDTCWVAGVMIRAEVIFKMHGDRFRLPEVTQWTDREQVVGIRFGNPVHRLDRAAFRSAGRDAGGNRGSGA